MRKSLWIVLAVLFVAISAPVSHADTFTDYTLSFTLTDGMPIAASVGTVIFDNTKGVFTTFPVEWNGVAFDFGPGAFTITNIPLTGSWNACGDTVSNDCAGGFSAFGIGSEAQLGDTPLVSANADGSYALTVVTTPEPSSVALMLLGVGLVFVMRKLIGQGLPQAS